VENFHGIPSDALDELAEGDEVLLDLGQEARVEQVQPAARGLKVVLRDGRRLRISYDAVERVL
jgi:preprotein translocase subunit YajC